MARNAFILFLLRHHAIRFCFALSTCITADSDKQQSSFPVFAQTWCASPAHGPNSRSLSVEWARRTESYVGAREGVGRRCSRRRGVAWRGQRAGGRAAGVAQWACGGSAGLG
ncbi:hypothetical protein DFH11DRAFT_1632666, partial [Phellopilus nigrolimitatus]